MRSWRNWQTRTFEGRVGNRMGSSPIDRTKFNRYSPCYARVFAFRGFSLNGRKYLENAVKNV